MRLCLCLGRRILRNKYFQFPAGLGTFFNRLSTRFSTATEIHQHGKGLFPIEIFILCLVNNLLVRFSNSGRLSRPENHLKTLNFFRSDQSSEQTVEHFSVDGSDSLSHSAFPVPVIETLEEHILSGLLDPPPNVKQFLGEVPVLFEWVRLELEKTV